MDATVNSIFRQLFHRRAWHCLRGPSSLSSFRRPARFPPIQQRRHIFTDDDDPSQRESDWQQRTSFLPQLQKDHSEEFKHYPMVTAEQLRRQKERPRRVKMLLRDFIDDSLYNPQYGYFSKQAVIFTPGSPFEFHKMKDESEFHRQLGQRYAAFEDHLDSKSLNETRQLWHTPTELFQPFYGEAMARYLISNYKLTLYPYHDLIIYELGAGNGTLMLNILDYIKAIDPDVYARTQFRVIEISSSLATLQHKTIHQSSSAKQHRDRINIINRSIFQWDTYVSSPCFFLACEVIDNFAHDAIRYDPLTEQPVQGTVLIDSQGDFHEFYIPQIDPLAARYLHLRQTPCDDHHHPTMYPHYHPLHSSWKWLRRFRAQLPFAGNLTHPEYIPVRLMQFFDILAEYFPGHQLVLSDFHELPNAVKGVNAPVVQTRYKRQVVPVSTPLVKQGYFDILFPTDFRVMESIYRVQTHKLTRVLSQEEFLSRWTDEDDLEYSTRTMNGENVMLGWYRNASVMTTL
ncbi:MAG: autophagy protein 6 [Watsoniomyces obsoletus]|nr:MAG: autophagy protein 6 [Watsoniomyces obsoletus]